MSQAGNYYNTSRGGGYYGQTQNYYGTAGRGGYGFPGFLAITALFLDTVVFSYLFDFFSPIHDSGDYLAIGLLLITVALLVLGALTSIAVLSVGSIPTKIYSFLILAGNIYMAYQVYLSFTGGAHLPLGFLN